MTWYSALFTSSGLGHSALLPLRTRRNHASRVNLFSCITPLVSQVLTCEFTGFGNELYAMGVGVHFAERLG